MNILVCCYIVHWFTLGPLDHVGVMWDLCWVYVELGWFMLGSCWCKNGGSGLDSSEPAVLGSCWGHVGAMLDLCAE